ncbi:MAG: hypothetical protein EDS66_10190 [Planctomycetota bacterium]|nr:MAG: hypothetical protein EDS66_10190 [Planctomycetota bacterium]MCQ3919936.1 hypothetical protein [Planctomycetota bacterium]
MVAGVAPLRNQRGLDDGCVLSDAQGCHGAEQKRAPAGSGSAALLSTLLRGGSFPNLFIRERGDAAQLQRHQGEHG